MPLKSVLPAGVALVLTFVVTGIIHDIVTMAVRRDMAFLFTPWFLLLGIGVVVSNTLAMDIGALSWRLRAATHFAYLAGCLVLAIFLFPVT